MVLVPCMDVCALECQWFLRYGYIYPMCVGPRGPSHKGRAMYHEAHTSAAHGSRAHERALNIRNEADSLCVTITPFEFFCAISEQHPKTLYGGPGVLVID